MRLAQEINGDLFDPFTKKEIIYGFPQKPIELKLLLAEVTRN